ncbi:PTS sugar transporter subunit IIC [Erysipelothrix amsterdamensis]|uniref:Phosphotransferase system EIIC domain-containing protein n=2 Tax=Erysipelothrix TaxID=1647 RepID=E7FUM5_ERYRH|nr:MULTISPECIES: PTS sugar transporter subunit IIC [Erysipelothrix]CAH2762206.1 PTS sugar transporter subunit IIC [Erysipelothrix sp. A18Y020d]AGN23942.1 putative regulatory protein [Erysipelothrix rhusiopathiae SY1027]AMS11266.1 PTS sugar transporter subunit IIABC [Erysipelothrix rhusiopathiae]AOO67764.1 PTS sugar transporter subunit IIABC [Erysipelothrix rhusiopathiae]AWU41378.1 PTS sugar transporter subunit IIC [Erysipelothrix rhusiopathiae]
MEKMNSKDFMNKILQGAAMGIVVGLIPNAIFGEIFKALGSHFAVFATLAGIVFAIQFTVPVLVGMFSSLEFKLNGLQMASVIGAAFIGSGAARLVEGAWVLKGTGDLINTMLTVAVAILIIRWYNNRIPNLAIVITPIIGGVIPGFIGLLTLPYVGKITGLLGSLIANFTTLQPLLMMILIAVCFALIIVTPLSTVAIAYAISLAGLGSGAANVGIAATVFTLAYGSSKVNNKGTTFALFFAGPKMLMPNYLKNPIMSLPIAINAAVTGVVAYIFQIQGTTASAGFGITGLAGPINAYSFMTATPVVRIIILLVQYLVVPLGIAMVTHTIFTKMDLYKNEIFTFNSGK